MGVVTRTWWWVWRTPSGFQDDSLFLLACQQPLGAGRGCVAQSQRVVMLLALAPNRGVR